MNAGWYSDPNGGPDLRWWDGSAWTVHTSPPPSPVPADRPAPASGEHRVPAAVAPPAVGSSPGGDQWPSPAAAPPPGSPPPYPSSGPPGGFPPAQGQPGDSKRTLLIALVALIVVLVGVGGFVVLSGDDEAATDPTTTTTAADDATTTTTDDETTTTTAATSPDSEFVSSGGLTFTRLSAPWEDWLSDGRGQISELSGTAGQFVVVQEQAPSGGQWIGNLLIGDLASTFAYTGEADLPATTHALANQLIATYYVEGAQTTIVQETPVTVDGHAGYFIHHELTFSQEGLEATREKVIVVVVDTGRARPGVFYASIPYNRADLNDGMNEVYRTLQVND